MPEKCKDCCSRLFCMSVAEVNGEDFEAMANKKDCRKRVFTNADRIRAMSDEKLAECAGDDLTSALLALLDTVPAHQKLYPELYVDKIVKLVSGGK